MLHGARKGTQGTCQGEPEPGGYALKELYHMESLFQSRTAVSGEFMPEQRKNVGRKEQQKETILHHDPFVPTHHVGRGTGVKFSLRKGREKVLLSRLCFCLSISL